jgi:Methylase involved in ubiquinone/menaquinone biosynthesis
MKSFEEMWNELSIYLMVDNALEQGYSNGKYTKVLASYAKKVVGIDVSDEFYEIAKSNLNDYDNIELKVMDALNMNFEDKSFDVLLNTSFHEFDLSGEIYSVDLVKKRKILEEMIRVTDTIIFIEPTEEAITNELFKVFNPSENHRDRIEKSNKLIDEVLKENKYELVKMGLTYNEDIFASKEELEEEMLDWWSDIKIPSNKEEKQKMIDQIDNILKEAGMLQKLSVVEDIRYVVYKRKEN